MQGSPSAPPSKPSTDPAPFGTGRFDVATTLLLKGGFLFAVWVLLSGKYEAFHLGTGFVGVCFLLWLDSRLEPLSGSGGPAQVHPLRWIYYYFWLLWQMVIAGFYVARVIINPSRHLNPHMVRFRSVQPNVVASVSLANSITLTPGTLTVDVQDDCYLVHALTERTARDLLDGSMQARVARLFVDRTPPAIQALPVDGATVKEEPRP